ncbi:hypothetical protein SAMN04488125_11068 [Methylorubrum salsuginis]|uniref:Uncharacterized protein n=1 Tax=Methylorubrum salsuginis TaxID=414703 RepID=A0A1I4FLZ0_9HYPH|nr:hypothetical protein SAMN04488125_11068 [Methylorubrum salsuginis]
MSGQNRKLAHGLASSRAVRRAGGPVDFLASYLQAHHLCAGRDRLDFNSDDKPSSLHATQPPACRLGHKESECRLVRRVRPARAQARIGLDVGINNPFLGVVLRAVANEFSAVPVSFCGRDQATSWLQNLHAEHAECVLFWLLQCKKEGKTTLSHGVFASTKLPNSVRLSLFALLRVSTSAPIEIQAPESDTTGHGPADKVFRLNSHHSSIGRLANSDVEQHDRSARAADVRPGRACLSARSA